MLLPVNNSLPAAITRLKAAAKVKDTRNLVEVEPAAVAKPPMVMETKLPKEINIPATMEAIR